MSMKDIGSRFPFSNTDLVSPEASSNWKAEGYTAEMALTWVLPSTVSEKEVGFSPWRV